MKFNIGALVRLLLVCIIISSCAKKKESIFTGNLEFAELSSVKLLDGPFKEAMERDRSYLYVLDSDRLLHYFRLTAGLDTLVSGYRGWEELEVRGHTIGHYLSACAMMSASIEDTILKEKTKYIINELAICQQAIGSGYVSAFPEEFIDRVENIEPVWAPYYTLHKIMAGLYDCYKLLDNKQALQVLRGMADWLAFRCEKIGYQKMQDILDHCEQGGINEVLFNLYAATGDSKYLELGQKFYQESYFRPILSYYDSLKGRHVNSFIPNVIGLIREYELTGNEECYQISKWFWEQVTSSRSYVTGGTSNGELWNNDPYHMHTELGPSSHETCCTYNMLKLTKHLFGIKQQAEYMDYYERALWNGILPTQDPSTNMTMYYVPMQSGYYKTFSTPENSFWCCTGTGMENFANLGEAIYATGNNRLYINLYIASLLEIKDQGFSVLQETNLPEENRVSLKIKSNSPAWFTLCLRIPAWTNSGYELFINGRQSELKVESGNFIEINRLWKTGDKIDLVFPMQLRLESLPSTHQLFACLFGPVVMAIPLSDTALTRDKVYGIDGPYLDKPQEEIPVIAMKEIKNVSEQFIQVDHLKFHALTTEGDTVAFIPFYKLFNSRYMIYFNMNQEI